MVAFPRAAPVRRWLSCYFSHLAKLSQVKVCWEAATLPQSTTPYTWSCLAGKFPAILQPSEEDQRRIQDMRSNHNVPSSPELGTLSSMSPSSQSGFILDTADLHMLRRMVLDLPQWAYRQEYQTLA